MNYQLKDSLSPTAMFNFELDDLIARHPSHAAPLQSFYNSITTFFGRHRSLDAVARFIIRPVVSKSTKEN
jgi:hypothetical protein